MNERRDRTSLEAESKTGRRATDGASRWQRFKIWWGRYGRDLTTFVAVGISFWSVSLAQSANDTSDKATLSADRAVRLAEAQVRALVRESAERRDQSCVVFERQEESDIKTLEQTYSYLVALTPQQLREPINRTILAQLGQAEAAARTPDAPAYCNKPGIGLAEPGLKIPKRPKKLTLPKR